MKKERTIVKAIEEQFRRTFAMWKEEVKNIPADEWRKGKIDYLIPSRHLCHMAVTADYYVGDALADEYDWNSLFGGDWEAMCPEDLPNKKKALEKLGEIEKIVNGRLAKPADKDLYVNEKQSPWTGKTLASKLMYLLRHTQHHLGELHAELRHRGIERAKWR
jgi:uncharacterized damage-inducible protein DinB